MPTPNKFCSLLYAVLQTENGWVRQMQQCYCIIWWHHGHYLVDTSLSFGLYLSGLQSVVFVGGSLLWLHICHAA